jgi:proteasome activator subunit 4
MTAPLIRLFLEKTYDNHPSIRYYAQRAVMKGLRYIKHRSYCHDPADLMQGLHHNPLKTRIAAQPSHSFTAKVLDNFKNPVDIKSRKPLFCDKLPQGWLAWGDELELYRLAQPTSSTFLPWEKASAAAVASVREVVTDSSFWTNLSERLSEENHQDVITQDNVSCVKSIFQLLDDEPFEALKPTLDSLLSDKDKDKQRAAAELLAGVLNGQSN